MRQYYYPVASLPLLSFEMEKLPSIETFRELCRDWLSASDFERLESASCFGLGLAGPASACSALLKRWLVWEISLRNELARLRAQKKGEDEEKYLRFGGEEIPLVQEIARAALSLESPLATEENLIRARWDYLDELELGHYFDIEKLIAYYLKLQLLERKAKHAWEAGLAKFGEIYQSLSAQIDTKAGRGEPNTAAGA